MRSTRVQKEVESRSLVERSSSSDNDRALERVRSGPSNTTRPWIHSCPPIVNHAFASNGYASGVCGVGWRLRAGLGGMYELMHVLVLLGECKPHGAPAFHTGWWADSLW